MSSSVPSPTNNNSEKCRTRLFCGMGAKDILVVLLSEIVHFFDYPSQINGENNFFPFPKAMPRLTLPLANTTTTTLLLLQKDSIKIKLYTQQKALATFPRTPFSPFPVQFAKRKRKVQAY